MTRVRLRAALARGIRKKCPQCGDGDLFQRWIRLHDYCPKCGLRYLEDQGDLWAYLLFIDRGFFILPIIAVIYFKLFNLQGIGFYVFFAGLMAVFIATLPHRNGLSVGLNYYLRKGVKYSKENLSSED